MSFLLQYLSTSSRRKSSVTVLSILIITPGIIFIATSALKPSKNIIPSQRKFFLESTKLTLVGNQNASRIVTDREPKSKYFTNGGIGHSSTVILNGFENENGDHRTTEISSFEQYAFHRNRKLEDIASRMGGFDYNDDTIDENLGNPSFTSGGRNSVGEGNGREEGSATDGDNIAGYNGYGTYGSYSSAGGNTGSGRNNGFSAGANGVYGGVKSGYGGGFDDTMQSGYGTYGGASSSYGLQEAGNAANSIDAYGSYGGYSSAATSSNYRDSYSEAWGTSPSGSTSFKSRMKSELGKPFQTKVSLLPIVFLFIVFSLAGMLATAHHMENNPEGTFANCCRVSLGTVACVYGVIYNLYHCRLGDIPQVVCAADEDVMDDYTDEELERMKLRPGIERALDVEHRKALRKVGIEMNKIKAGSMNTNHRGGGVPGASGIQR